MASKTGKNVKYEVHWYMIFVGEFDVEAQTDKEAMEIAELELHHNNYRLDDFLSEHPSDKEVDITELVYKT